MWGVIPAAGRGSRMQPLAFSKELLPVGSEVHRGSERPRAVSEYLVERMLAGGATRLCFVISPGKHDILDYYSEGVGTAQCAYVMQSEPRGLCDSLFRSLAMIEETPEPVLVGLPDTIWFPLHGFTALPEDEFSFLLFPVEHPQYFDAVVTDATGRVREVQVKQSTASTHWVWGAFKLPGTVLHQLHRLWLERERQDEYLGTLVNEYLRRGGRARGVRAGERYVDVGTFHGYREALQMLAGVKLTA